MTSIIELSNLNYQVDDLQILKNINLQVNSGENITITGPSGGGKSTLLKILATLLSKTGGTFKYESQPIENYDPITYRKEVSYCFQQPTLFGETVADNLVFPYQIRQQAFDKQHAIQSLKEVGLDEADLDKKIITLSGGEKQRVALTRNLLFIPKILLLDEVTAGLDADNQDIVLNLVNDYATRSDLTLIAITHNQAEIESATRLVHIKSGELEETK